MNHSRRTLLRSATTGFSCLALQALLGEPRALASPEGLVAKAPPLAARAKRAIFLCMSGGPAQLDTFDYKPQTGSKPHPGSVFRFDRHGESGVQISELLPETAKHADRLCVINGMHADTEIHAQSFLQLHTGDRLRERPSLGSWVVYGLGTENQNLPGFISLNTSKSSIYSSSFLPSIYSGTPIGVNGEDMTAATIADVRDDRLSIGAKRRQLDFVQRLNNGHLLNDGHLARRNDERLDGAIRTMELGFRMQLEAPGLLDLGGETQETLERYRVGQKKEPIGTCQWSDFGRQCLLARRFVEAGVRFVEVNHGSWDQHKNHRRDLKANCDATDAPVGALLHDLHERGLLEETLLIWGGEFGRPGLTPEDGKDESGHAASAFTFWLAGGGVKGGHVHGKTDATGAVAVEGKVHFRDLHATILHLMGLPANELTYRYAGRDHRITGPEGGNVVTEIFA